MTVAVTQTVGMPVIDQERPLIGHGNDLRYVIKISVLSQCRTNEQNVRSARKSEQRGMTVIGPKLCANMIVEISTSRVTDQVPSQVSRNLHAEAIPKSVARVLNASQIRSEWKQSLGKRKQRNEERDIETDSQCKSRKRSRTKRASVASEDTKLPPMRIQPGESLTHFNKLGVRDCF